MRTSKANQEGDKRDVRYLKNGCASAIRRLRDRLTVLASGIRPAGTDAVLGGLNGASVGRRLTAAARAAGIEGRITGRSGRIGLASELTRLGASTTETMLAGGWATSRMVAHYAAGATAEAGAVAKYLQGAGVPLSTMIAAPAQPHVAGLRGRPSLSEYRYSGATKATRAP